MRLNIYLNFPGTAEQAFLFYSQVFASEITHLSRFAEVPDLPGREYMSEEDLQKIMHIAMPLGGMELMATDVLPSMMSQFVLGTNTSLSLHPESLSEAEKLFAALAQGGETTLPLQKMFWGDHFGMLTDRFGVQWMLNVSGV
jgi:PhnB protein